MTNATLPFQKIHLSEMAQHIDQDGNITNVLNVCGFLLCKKGWAKVNLNDSTYIIRQGDMYIYAPSTFINIIAWSNDLEGIAFKSTLDYILPFLERASSQRMIISIRNNPCITLSEVQQQSIEEMVQLLDKKVVDYKKIEENAPHKKLMLRELECLSEAFVTELLIYYIGNHASVTPEIPNHKDKIVQSFLISLFKNYKVEREVQFYAEQMFLTPRYFSTVVKEKTGKTALTWISEMVISNACQLLTYSDLTIKEIAMELNFPSQSFFGKYFKQYMHCSPNKYRLLHRER